MNDTEAVSNTETVKTVEVSTPRAKKAQVNTTDGYSRYLGFRHRVKVKIVDGVATEPLPSVIVILNSEGIHMGEIELPTEQAELDYINGILPVKYRNPEPTEDISTFKEWQIVWRSAKDNDVLTERHPSQCKWKSRRGKGGEPSTSELVEVAKEVPCEWTGFQNGDALGMCLGGSGDYFALAASNKLHGMNGEVFRIPPFKLVKHRGNDSKENDAKLLAEAIITCGEDFYPTVVRDKAIILVRETFKIRTDAMKDRMACVQRLRQRIIGMKFCSLEGGFPDGDIEKSFEELKANDPIFCAIARQEDKAMKEMTTAVEGTDVWKKLFEALPGVGPAIAARIISAIIDIRRFETDAKLKAFMGVHVLKDGTFPRRRNGLVSNWHPDARQALYLLADQFVKKPGSAWGTRLNEYKKRLREKHPQVCVQITQATAEKIGIKTTEKYVLIPIGLAPQPAKKRYTAKHPVTGEEITITGPQKYGDGHIHKMAIWRTLSKFVEWLHREWWKLEDDARKGI